MKKLLLLHAIFMFNFLFSDTIHLSGYDRPIKDVTFVGNHNKKIIFTLNFDTSNTLYFVHRRLVASIVDQDGNLIDYLNSDYNNLDNYLVYEIRII